MARQDRNGDAHYYDSLSRKAASFAKAGSPADTHTQASTAGDARLDVENQDQMPESSGFSNDTKEYCNQSHSVVSDR